MRNAYSKRKEKLVLQARWWWLIAATVDVASLDVLSKQVERDKHASAGAGTRTGSGSRRPGKVTWIGVLRQQDSPP
jgi:hypothetical protein